MLVGNCTFRELDQRWVAIENKRMVKKLAKKLKHKEWIPPLFGYFYIDREEGLSLRVMGNVEKDGYNKLYLSDYFRENEIVVSVEVIEKFNVEFIDSDVVNKINGTKEIEEDLAFNYESELNLLKTREIEEIDPFRNETFPDDVQVLLESNDDDPDELLWARIEGIMKKDVLICHLLTESYYNEQYKEDTMVGVRYFEESKDEEECLKIVGLIKRKEKSD